MVIFLDNLYNSSALKNRLWTTGMNGKAIIVHMLTATIFFPPACKKHSGRGTVINITAATKAKNGLLGRVDFSRYKLETLCS